MQSLPKAQMKMLFLLKKSINKNCKMSEMQLISRSKHVFNLNEYKLLHESHSDNCKTVAKFYP